MMGTGRITREEGQALASIAEALDPLDREAQLRVVACVAIMHGEYETAEKILRMLTLERVEVAMACVGWGLAMQSGGRGGGGRGR